MDMLWSLSTTLRNPERISDFFMTISELDGYTWTKETQMRLQALLIKNRLFVPTEANLSTIQIDLLNDLSKEMTYEQARKIFDDKHYEDPPMRGRTSFSPVAKMGLVHVIDGCIKVSELGKKYLNGEIEFGDVIFHCFLKLQYPNPLSEGFNGYNTKPFINTLRIIKKVNELCLVRNIVAKGITREELGIFVLSLKDYKNVDNVANKILDFRAEKDRITDVGEKREFTEKYIEQYLFSFQDPIKNTYEYSDNMLRCLRLTKFIYIRGGGYYIDLEPRRMVEIDSILAVDKGEAKHFTRKEWIEYMADFSSYKLPWEEPQKLVKIKKQLFEEINKLETTLNLPLSRPAQTKQEIYQIKEEIEEKRTYRTELQTQSLKIEFQSTEKIDLTIGNLENIRNLGQKPSIELEKLSNLALNIIDDAIKIKPNCPVGDDNEIIFTAPAKVPDIECFYQSFNSICEVTMLTGRNQWFNEGQPVMRHLRDFETKYSDKPAYCLFVAPSIHQDTLNTFWNSVKHEYEGKSQKIIPITISQLILLLKAIKRDKKMNLPLSHHKTKTLFDSCTEISQMNDSNQWKELIDKKINELQV
jgi:hypothetical protein